MSRVANHPKCLAEKMASTKVLLAVLSQVTTTRHLPFTTYCRRIGEEGLCWVLISKSAVDFEPVFEVEKRFKKCSHFLKTARWFKRPRLDQISTSVDACAILGLYFRKRHTLGNVRHCGGYRGDKYLISFKYGLSLPIIISVILFIVLMLDL